MTTALPLSRDKAIRTTGESFTVTVEAVPTAPSPSMRFRARLDRRVGERRVCLLSALAMSRRHALVRLRDVAIGANSNDWSAWCQAIDSVLADDSGKGKE